MKVRILGHILSAGICILGAALLLVLFTGKYVLQLYGSQYVLWKLSSLAIAICFLLLLKIILASRRFSLAVLIRYASAILFSLSLMIYLANGRRLGSTDTIPARFLPMSILREGDFDLDEFRFIYRQSPLPNFVKYSQGHYVSFYPVGAAISAIPFYILSAIGPVNAHSNFLVELEKFSAACLVALSVVLFYWMVRRFTTRKMSFLLALIYAFGTSSLSVSSQGLWQHGPSQLALIAGIYCLLRGRKIPAWYSIAGFCLAFSVVCRPTDALFVLPLSFYVLLHHRSGFVKLVLGALAPVAFQLLYNVIYFGNVFRTQFSITESWRTSFLAGLGGILISPGRGLLFYSPVFFFCLAAIFYRSKKADPVLPYLGVGLLLNIILYSKWKTWWGGLCYGPRMLADITPILTLFLFPVRQLLVKRPFWKWIFMTAVIFSFAAHAIGPFWDQLRWNSNMFIRYPHRGLIGEVMWSWTDNPLTNTARQTWSRFKIAVYSLATTENNSGNLSGSYQIALPARGNIRFPVRLRITVVNEGEVVWLSRTKRRGSEVKVRLCWLTENQQPSDLCRSIAIGTDLFPRKPYQLEAYIETPEQPGNYFLEVKLESPGAHFEQRPLLLVGKIGRTGKVQITQSQRPSQQF